MATPRQCGLPLNVFLVFRPLSGFHANSLASDIDKQDARPGGGAVAAPPSTISDAVTISLSALSYRTQSWSMSMPIDGLHW